jgi:hypothetical protein
VIQGFSDSKSSAVELGSGEQLVNDGAGWKVAAVEVCMRPTLQHVVNKQ